jgi:hypothetical protein
MIINLSKLLKRSSPSYESQKPSEDLYPHIQFPQICSQPQYSKKLTLKKLTWAINFKASASKWELERLNSDVAAAGASDDSTEGLRS